MRELRFYTGVGSRNTPSDIQRLMTNIARQLRPLGFRLRSGHASGADQAFERGAGVDADIFLPWRTFEKLVRIEGTSYIAPSRQAESIAALYYPIPWSIVKQSTQKLMARNVHQVLGCHLNQPSEFLICWTPGGDGGGGTGQAIRVARGYSVPVFDLGNDDVLAMVERGELIPYDAAKV